MTRGAVALWPALLVAIACTACGASPVAPAPAPATPAGLSLSSGSYRLTITMSTTGACSTSPICGSVSLCSSFSNTPIVGVSVPSDVSLQRDGAAIAIRPDDTSATFRMSLQQTDASLSGTASGSYQSSGATMTVSDGHGGSATVTGSLLPSAVSGAISGDVSVNGSGCSNNGHTWSLMPR